MRRINDPRHSKWKELESLFYSKFYPLHEVHRDRNFIYNFLPRDTESIAQAWERLKILLLKCPNHGLPEEIIVTNFYARLSGDCKDYLDACSEGSFTSKKVETKWDLLETIQHNAESWENDKGKESGINYEYDCIKSFTETASFHELSAKYGLDSQIIVDCCRTFASHISIPKENWAMYHEPFKDTCLETEIVTNACNKHAQTSDNTVSYKHVNFCGALRPCKKNNNEEEYCKVHKHEKTRIWSRALSDLAEKICVLYPFICELCYEEGHFEFQCSKFGDTISSLFDDSMIDPDLYDELELFLGCKELSSKTSMLDMGAFDMNILQDCHSYCVDKSHTNAYIEKIIKDVALPKYERTDTCFTLINEREESFQVSSVVPNNKPGYMVKLPFKPLPPKEGKKKKKRRSKRREETISSPKHVAPVIVVADESELDDVPMPVTYSSDHDWENTLLLILKIFWVPILKMMILTIVILLILSMFLPIMI